MVTIKLNSDKQIAGELCDSPFDDLFHSRALLKPRQLFFLKFEESYSHRNFNNFFINRWRDWVTMFFQTFQISNDSFCYIIQ